jgi:hypothetical protein
VTDYDIAIAVRKLAYVDHEGRARAAEPRQRPLRLPPQDDAPLLVYDLPLGARPAECAEPVGYPARTGDGHPVGVDGWTRGHDPGVGPSWACPHCVRVDVTQAQAEGGIHVFLDGRFTGRVTFPSHMLRSATDER